MNEIEELLLVLRRKSRQIECQIDGNETLRGLLLSDWQQVLDDIDFLVAHIAQIAVDEANDII